MKYLVYIVYVIIFSYSETVNGLNELKKRETTILKLYYRKLYIISKNNCHTNLENERESYISRELYQYTYVLSS